MTIQQTLTGKLELKFAPPSATDADYSFTGYGSVFNNVDDYGDVIAPGAFTKSIADTKPAMLWQHDPRLPIGVWTDVAEDETGLKVAGHFLDTALGIDAYKAAKAGALSGLSIGYQVTGFERSTIDGKSVRTITEVRLLEISLVTFPANNLARVSDVKSSASEINDLKAEIAELRALISVSNAEPKEDDPINQTQAADDETEAKYDDTALSIAVNKIILKLQQECYVR